jgi:uncharacterized protein YecT (DUF1311 family)
MPLTRRNRLGVAVLTIACLPFGSAATAATAPAPPVIREPWTTLSCPTHPQSTIEIEGCLQRAILASDHRINMRVATIFRLIRRASDRTAFVEGKQAWLRYRRRSCTATASVYRGGSAEPVAFLSCEKSRNARHLADLADTERVLRQR